MSTFQLRRPPYLESEFASSYFFCNRKPLKLLAALPNAFIGHEDNGYRLEPVAMDLSVAQERGFNSNLYFAKKDKMCRDFIEGRKESEFFALRKKSPREAPSLDRIMELLMNEKFERLAKLERSVCYIDLDLSLEELDRSMATDIDEVIY